MQGQKFAIQKQKNFVAGSLVMKMNVVRDYQSPCAENILIVIIKFAEP